MEVGCEIEDSFQDPMRIKFMMECHPERFFGSVEMPNDMTRLKSVPSSFQ